MDLNQNASSVVRHRIIFALIVVIAFLSTTAVYRIATKPPKYRPKYQTIAHRFLDLENTYTPVPEESYALLDHLITAVKANTHFDPTITDRRAKQRQLLQVFAAIDSIVIANNFIFPPGEYTATLGQALDDSDLTDAQIDAAVQMSHNARRVEQIKGNQDKVFHLMSCEPAAFLYMGIAQELGFQLRPVMLPDHVFVRAQIDDKHWINWDPNRGRSITDEEYARDWNVQDWQIQRKIFLHSLTDDEILGNMYAEIACRLGDSDLVTDVSRVVECNRQALRLDPLCSTASTNLPIWLLFTPHPCAAAQTEATQLAQRSLEMEPEAAAAHSTQAYVFASIGNTTAATAEMQKAIDLDPENVVELRAGLALIQDGDTTYEVFKSQRPIACWLWYEHGWLYLFVVAAGGLAAVVVWKLRALLGVSQPELSTSISRAEAPGGSALSPSAG